MLSQGGHCGQRLIIRADADSRMGTGHVMRCLALGEAWQTRGGMVLAAGRIESASLRQRLIDHGIAVLELTAGTPATDDLQWLAHLSTRQDAKEDWLALDGYHFDQAYQQRLRKTGVKLLVIDDFAHLPAYDVDLLLNQNPGSDQLHYQTPPETVLLRGGRYLLLRREFREGRRAARLDCREVAGRLLITLGGADPDNVTLKVMDALALLELPAVEAKIVVGPANPHLPLLRERLRQGALARVELLIDVADMAPVIKWAEVAVTAGGSTCWELASLGLPALIITLADNQLGVAHSLAAAGAGLDCGWHHALVPSQLARQIDALCRDRDLRQAMSAAGRALVDGEGADRVVECMRSYPFAFREAQPEDGRLVFDWANDPVIRAASFHPNAISRPEHEKWYARTLADPTTLFWIIMLQGDQPVGQVRFVKKDGEAVISVSLATGYRKQGLGSRAIALACARLFELSNVSVVHALIRQDNESSVKSFDRAGFVRASSEMVAGVAALKMSLRKMP